MKLKRLTEVEIIVPDDATITTSRPLVVKGCVHPDGAEVQVLLLAHDGRWYAQDYPEIEGNKWSCEVQVGAVAFKGGQAVPVTDPAELDMIRLKVFAAKDETKRWYQIAAAGGPRLADDVVDSLPMDRVWSLILVQRGDPEPVPTPVR
jgi:hypothetical protein